MVDSFFKQLNDTEKQEYIQWARDNFMPDMVINPVWHPVIRDELNRLQSQYEQESYSCHPGLYEDYNCQWDDDPSPYDGTYSED